MKIDLQPISMGYSIMKILVILTVQALVNNQAVQALQCYSSNGVEKIDNEKEKIMCKDLHNPPMCYGFTGNNSGVYNLNFSNFNSNLG